MTVAYIGGTFDMMHYGHIRLFKAAKERFGYVVVSLNTDDFTTRFKRMPIMNLQERIETVEGCRYVDQVIVNVGGEDSKPAILLARPTHIVHGDDWTGPAYLKQLGINQDWINEYGIKMAYLPYTAGVSTSQLLERVKCQMLS